MLLRLGDHLLDRVDADPLDARLVRMMLGETADELPRRDTDLVAGAVRVTEVVAQIADQLMAGVVIGNGLAHVLDERFGHLSAERPARPAGLDVLVDFHAGFPRVRAAPSLVANR